MALLMRFPFSFARSKNGLLCGVNGLTRVYPSVPISITSLSTRFSRLSSAACQRLSSSSVSSTEPSSSSSPPPPLSSPPPSSISAYLSSLPLSSASPLDALKKIHEIRQYFTNKKNNKPFSNDKDKDLKPASAERGKKRPGIIQRHFAHAVVDYVALMDGSQQRITNSSSSSPSSSFLSPSSSSSPRTLVVLPLPVFFDEVMETLRAADGALELTNSHFWHMLRYKPSL